MSTGDLQKACEERDFRVVRMTPVVDETDPAKNCFFVKDVFVYPFGAGWDDETIETVKWVTLKRLLIECARALNGARAKFNAACAAYKAADAKMADAIKIAAGEGHEGPLYYCGRSYKLEQTFAGIRAEVGLIDGIGLD